MLAGFDLYRRMISIKIRSQMQYRGSFLLDLLATALVSAVSFLSIALVLQTFDGIGGWSLWEVAFLYGSVELSFGIMDMLFGGFDPPYFGNHVRLGTFDQMLLKPANIYIQVLAQSSCCDGWGAYCRRRLSSGWRWQTWKSPGRLSSWSTCRSCWPAW
jgi:ABC-2 type transport system permease protein